MPHTCMLIRICFMLMEGFQACTCSQSGSGVAQLNKCMRSLREEGHPSNPCTAQSQRYSTMGDTTRAQQKVMQAVFIKAQCCCLKKKRGNPCQTTGHVEQHGGTQIDTGKHKNLEEIQGIETKKNNFCTKTLKRHCTLCPALCVRGMTACYPMPRK